MPDALWEKLATYGALGIIVAWLFLERFLTGSKERKARHALANAVTASNLTVSTLCTKIEDLNRALWQFIFTNGGRHADSKKDSRGDD